MAVDFRGHPMFPSTGFNAPTRFEADIYDCEVWRRSTTCQAHPPYAFDIRPGTGRHVPMSAQVAAADQAWVA